MFRTPPGFRRFGMLCGLPACGRGCASPSVIRMNVSHEQRKGAPELARAKSGALCWLKQLDRIPIGIEELDLLAARSGDDVASKADAVLAQRRDDGREIVDSKDEAIPAPGLLRSIRQRPGAGAAWTAQEHIE